MAFVSEEGAVRVAGLDILQEMEVMHARPGQVERRDAPVQPADGVQIESVNGCLARRSIRRREGSLSFLPIVQHLARAIRHAATGMESMQKQSSPPSGHPLMDALAEQGRGLAPVVVSPAG